ncbi:hypothetical protein [Agrobacterium rubi]|uniref:Uncharacterized protein n=1 Tax=Agrobacterium rubi TaxID=28099 RepID=A0AAE7QZQ0_9HYPH|nr:hypothetical protein [Agrobacterium rubi]NTE86767.1 hypothetical protein [Agrobacterium rubi]NTF02701.1 hypothetical protein [Agrobacterium rubi]NTF36945.1 hypothetical protein [Agrobacterium rubi]OCJ55455.1 hypothetical protein A6U92_02310 [Agrobacterium rubi]QTF99384.1 hypothetical protein G6M88_02750 [Agrobacterium rubi]
MSKRLRQLDQALFSRSYLLTIGLLMFVGASVVGYVAWNDSLQLEWWGVLLVAAIILGGALLFGFGLFGSDTRMEGWADGASTHEASTILFVISYPVYLILKLFHRPR